MIDLFLEDVDAPRAGQSCELEVRFGNKNHTLTKIDCTNVVNYLYNANYLCLEKEGQHMMRILPEVSGLDASNGSKKENLRLELRGIDAIRCYRECGEDLGKMLLSPTITAIMRKITKKEAISSVGFESLVRARKCHDQSRDTGPCHSTIAP